MKVVATCKETKKIEVWAETIPYGKVFKARISKHTSNFVGCKGTFMRIAHPSSQRLIVGFELDQSGCSGRVVDIPSLFQDALAFDDVVYYPDAQLVLGEPAK